MEHELAHDVQRMFRAITTVLGDTFAFAALVTLTELWRGKPLRIEDDVMPAAMSGYCVALQDVDLICVRQGLDPILRRSVQLHEIAHLLLGHLPQMSSGLTTPPYRVFVQRRDLSAALQRAYVGAYAEPDEHAAETLGTLLFECLLREERAMPAPARGLYG